MFEIKWDGTRTLAFIENKTVKLLNRRRVDLTERYPEFGILRAFPAGTVLDGELVVLREGKSDFGLLMSREQARSPLRIRLGSQSSPATYMVFDLLYAKHQSLMLRPLHERRQHLQKLVDRYGQGKVILSESTPGDHGRAYFAEACRMGLEGVIAKRLNSQYRPGQRTDDWIKIKRSEVLDCAIIGFVPSGTKDFRSLILATNVDGELRCVGRVGTGFDSKLRIKLNKLLWKSIRKQSWVPCSIKGKWVEPGLYCRVTCMERTSRGELRAPVFMELYEEH